MALILLQVIVLGVTAAALHDVPITWAHIPSGALPCVVPEWSRRRPPLLLDEDRTRSNRSYVWRRGDSEFSGTRIYSNGSLVVSNKKDVEGVYQCGVRHNSRLVLGYPVNFKFAYMDNQFAVHPRNESARLGQSAVLSCSINSGPPANISWERNGVTLPRDARYHMLANQLLITNVKKEDAGTYRCKATNRYVNHVPISHAGQLRVQKSEDQDVAFLNILYDKNITAARGSKVLLPCPVVGSPKPKLIWELTPADGRTCELDVTNEVLELSHLEYDQEGMYTCSVEGHSELVKTFHVTLWEPVKITLPPTSKETIRASTVRLNCTATGRPEPSISWYKDGQPLEPVGRFNLRTSTDKARIELVISGVTSDDAGIYQCFASTPWSVASSWALLKVRGTPSAAPPADVSCAPLGPSRIEVRWRATTSRDATYIVCATPKDAGEALTTQPHNETKQTVTVKKALSPYFIQARAFVSFSKEKWMGVASDMSEPVICQGQGIPFKLIKLENDTVMVSWNQFWEQTPGVAEWILQYREKGEAQEHNITLDASVYNFTLAAPPSFPLEVRVLGSRTVPWLPQDLSRLPWVSTITAAPEILDDGDTMVVPKDLQAEVGPRSFKVKWRVEGDQDRFTYVVCVRRMDDEDDCKESLTNYTIVEGLQPGKKYEVRVQARLPGRLLGGAFSDPLQLTTQYEASVRFKDLSYKFLNSSTLRVSWGGDGSRPARYTVRYSSQLDLPMDQWAVIETYENTVDIRGIDPAEQTFVMVTKYKSVEHNQVLSVPAQVKELDVKDLKYAYSSNGVTVWWGATEENDQAGEAGEAQSWCAAPRVVRYAQNITRPLEKWSAVNVTGCSIELNDLEPSLPVYVMVTTSGRSRHNQMLTIHPRPPHDSHSYIGIGVGCGVTVLCLLVIVAVCIRRRKKRPRTPNRRRIASGDDTIEEEGSEMKSVSATSGRLANGGVRDAGEPLLNGHVHITENPVSKTPNGRMKKGRHYEAFDLSHPEGDTTAETVVDDSTAYSLLDTSRRPEYDLSRSSRDIDSFNKLPDDNMNSELNRSSEFVLDNSKIHPTLQPNG